MAAPNIDNIMVQLEGQIGDEIYSRGLHTSLWLDLPKQENWPQGQGHIIQALTLGRSLPRNAVTWNPVTVSDGSAGGTCIPPVQRLEITNSLREYNLEQTSLESPDICLLDLMNSFKAEQQLSHMLEVLAENTRQVWIDRNRSEYIRLATHKLLATTNGLVEPVNGEFSTDATAVAALAPLKGKDLKNAYTRSVRLGAGKSSYGNVDGRPSFLAVCGMETNELIATETEYRNDTRWSNRVPELLAPLGIERMFKGFWLADDVNPPRYDLDVNGDWKEVPAYIWSAPSGDPTAELIENPAYETALAEDTIIFHADVMRSVVMPPARNYGSATFDPQKYRGDWSWKNVEHRTENPDGNYGFYRGVFAAGSKPVFPQYGFVIRHLRGAIA